MLRLCYVTIILFSAILSMVLYCIDRRCFLCWLPKEIKDKTNLNILGVTFATVLLFTINPIAMTWRYVLYICRW